MTDPLHDIQQYSATLTIAQVLKFCDKKALGITRAMIQNYIRDGLLPPPAGRIYTHKHLAALVMIQHLKQVFDMPSIKVALAPLMDAEGLPLATYECIITTQKDMYQQWQAHIAPIAAGAGDAAPLAVMAHVAGIHII